MWHFQEVTDSHLYLLIIYVFKNIYKNFDFAHKYVVIFVNCINTTQRKFSFCMKKVLVEVETTINSKKLMFN